MASTKAPRVSDTWLLNRGHQALELAEQHRGAIEPRVPAGLLDGLTNDLAELRGRQARVKEARSATKVATAAQNVALARAASVISAVGAAVRRDPTLNAEQRRAYGVGIKVHVRKVSSVVAAGSLIVDRATRKPDEARAIGLLDSDVEQLRQLVASLQEVDRQQEKLLANRPRTTADRNRAIARVYAAIKKIAGAGVLAFALDDDLRNEFDALDDLPRKTTKKKAA